MNLQICKNHRCLRIFELREIGDGMPLPPRQESYHCPWCHEVYQVLTSGACLTSRLSPAVEATLQQAMGLKD